MIVHDSPVCYGPVALPCVHLLLLSLSLCSCQSVSLSVCVKACPSGHEDPPLPTVVSCTPASHPAISTQQHIYPGPALYCLPDCQFAYVVQRYSQLFVFVILMFCNSSPVTNSLCFCVSRFPGPVWSLLACLALHQVTILLASSAFRC